MRVDLTKLKYKELETLSIDLVKEIAKRDLLGEKCALYGHCYEPFAAIDSQESQRRKCSICGKIQKTEWVDDRI